jgi:manganese transport protein
MQTHAEPPSDWRGILKQLGPGLIISANIVGSGELIVTTKLGADVGFMLLWFIILGCMVKVFLQVELGRYTISTGKTTLQALDTMPGPRFRVSWLVWCWLIMFIATFFQLAGIVGGIAEVLQLGGLDLKDTILAFFVTGSCAALLFIGRYRFIEKFSTIMVASFTIFTIFAVFSLYWTDFGIKASQIAEGLKFQIPNDLAVALGAFGVIGVGAAELIYYPYWCLEKGYASNVGPNDGSEAWHARAQGWIRVLKWDAWASMVIYTGATVAFYLLGAAVLHGQNIAIEKDNLISNLSNLYTTSFGNVGLWVFLVGGFAVLYSTVFISTASNSRLSVDFLRMFGWIKTKDESSRVRHVAIACIALPALYFIFYVTVGNPLGLVFVGAIAQALMLPFLCIAALYFLYTQTEDRLRPSKAWVLFLWISSAMMASVGIYQLVDKLKSM